jgi:phosphatidylserine synthase
MPLIHYLFTLLFYVCVSMSLGQWANTMGGNDPKAFFAGIPAFLSIILMILSFAVVPLVVRKKRMTEHLLLYGISLALCISLFRAVTPCLGSWIVD